LEWITPFLDSPDAVVVGLDGVRPTFPARREGRIVNEEHDESGRRRQVQELLLAYLRVANAPTWPGVDGLTLDEVLRSYPQAAADGFVPDLPALRQLHPESADILNDFFAIDVGEGERL
jgi:hypothetical protein